MQKKVDLKKAFARKYPEPVILVATRSPQGRTNVMAIGWHMVASSGPWMFALGIDDEAYTYELIRKTKEFVVAFPNEKMARQVLHAGSHHGRGRDKIKEAGITTQKASVVKAPLVADAVANFECKLVKIVRPGDCPILFGKIVAAHENRNPKARRLLVIGKDFRMGGVRPVPRAAEPR